jgi:hypothetical protein
MVCLVTAHLGYFLHDPSIPRVAAFVRATLPSPPLTFEVLAHGTLFVPIRILAAGWMVLLASQLIAELPGIASVVRKILHVAEGRRWLLPAMLACLWAPFLATFDTHVPFHWVGVDRTLYDFGERLRQICRQDCVYGSIPQPMIPVAAGLRFLSVDLPAHSNHYVREAHLHVVADLQARIVAGQTASADELLDRYKVAYVLQGPGSKDPVVLRCAGDLLASLGNEYHLYRRGPCRP